MVKLISFQAISSNFLAKKQKKIETDFFKQNILNRSKINFTKIFPQLLPHFYLW